MWLDELIERSCLYVTVRRFYRPRFIVLIENRLVRIAEGTVQGTTLNYIRDDSKYAFFGE